MRERVEDTNSFIYECRRERNECLGCQFLIIDKYFQPDSRNASR